MCMSVRHSKGIVAEELVAVLFVMVLLAVFIVFVIYANNRAIADLAWFDAERTASTLAEKLFFDSNGIVNDATTFVAVTNLTYPAKIVLTDLERNLSWEHGGTGTARSVASASAAILVAEPATGRYRLARLEVSVPA